MFYLVFILRRLLFVVFTLTMREQNYIQIIAMNYLNLSMLLYNGYNSPFNTRFRNRVEVVNEVFITQATFHFMLFTEFTKDAATHFKIGWSLAALIIVHITFNLSIVLGEMLNKIKLLFLKYYYRVKNYFKGPSLYEIELKA
jgi:hypothetical protein